MLVRPDEVANKEAAVEQDLQLCRFTEAVYPTWDALSPRKRILILGGGKFAGELCRVVRLQRFGMLEIVGALVGGNERIEKNQDMPEIIGTYEQVAGVVQGQKVTTVVVCLEDRRSILPVEQLLDLKAMGIDVRDGHQLFEEVSGRLSIDSLRPSAPSVFEWFQTTHGHPYYEAVRRHDGCNRRIAGADSTIFTRRVFD